MTAFSSSLRNGAAGEAIQPTLTECGKLPISSFVTTISGYHVTDVARDNGVEAGMAGSLRA